MPTYAVTDPQTGKTVRLTGDSPPTEAELGEIFASLSQQTEAQPPAEPPPAANSSGFTGDLKTDLATAAANDQERIKENAGFLPAIGGAVGGVVAGVPGAAVLGGVGEATRQVVLRGQGDASVPNEPIDQAKAMATEGAIQGALQGTGQVAMAGAGKLAKWLMNRATTRVTAKLMRDFPELSDTLIDNALTVSKGGYQRALGMLQSAKAKANAALVRADAAGAKVPIEFTPEVADSFKTALLETAVKSGRLPVAPNAPLSVATQRLTPEMKAIFAQIDEASQGGTFELSAKQADLLKTQLQKESRALYANRTAPNGQNAITTEATVKAEFASRLNDAIDGIAEGYKAANAEAKPLIGAVRGIQQAIRPNGNLYQAMVRPGVGAVAGGAAGSQKDSKTAVAGAVTGALLSTPTAMSANAIALKHPTVQQLLGQLPRTMYAAVISALGGPAADTPPPR